MSPAFSPITAAGSPHSGASRGGRPLEWTPSRTRKLIRAYLFTGSRMELILEAIKEPGWSPQKDAAIKWIRRELGHDSRWIRTKPGEETEQQVKALESSTRPIFRQSGTRSMATANIHQLDTSFPGQTGLGLHIETPLSGSVDAEHDFNWSFSPFTTSTPTWPLPPQFETFAPTTHDEWPRPRRQNSALSFGTVSSMTDTYRDRLSVAGAARLEANNLWKVTRRFTLPKSTTSSPSSTPLRAFPPGHQTFPSAGMPSILDQSRAGYAVSGDFINTGPGFRFADHNDCDQTTQAHDENHCWCALKSELFHNFERNGSALLSSDLNTETAWRLCDVDLEARDEFGHTPLHLLASLKDRQLQLLSIVNEASKHEHPILGAVNTAGQTLLHLLHPAWFLPESPLENLFCILKQSSFDILSRDVFGRNVFHIMREHNTDIELVRRCAFGLNFSSFNTRDAFGRMPLRARPSGPTQHMARTVQNIIAARRLTTSTTDSAIPESDSRIIAQTRLLSLIRTATGTDSAYANPTTEDFHGRNGFHALAEVILGVKPMVDHVARGQKRKYDLPDAQQPKQEPMPRIEHLEVLIHAKVDIDHYNMAGDTPLMAFVVQLPDGKTKAESVEVREVISRLVRAGADMEKRNRRGETALHIAARHGQKVAVDTLLKLGANPYVRNADGQSILDVVDRMLVVSEATANSLEACRKLLCGGSSMKVKPKQKPTILDEWTFGSR